MSAVRFAKKLVGVRFKENKKVPNKNILVVVPARQLIFNPFNSEVKESR